MWLYIYTRIKISLFNILSPEYKSQDSASFCWEPSAKTLCPPNQCCTTDLCFPESVLHNGSVFSRISAAQRICVFPESVLHNGSMFSQISAAQRISVPPPPPSQCCTTDLCFPKSVLHNRSVFSQISAAQLICDFLTMGLQLYLDVRKSQLETKLVPHLLLAFVSSHSTITAVQKTNTAHHTDDNWWHLSKTRGRGGKSTGHGANVNPIQKHPPPPPPPPPIYMYSSCMKSYLHTYNTSVCHDKKISTLWHTLPTPPHSLQWASKSNKESQTGRIVLPTINTFPRQNVLCNDVCSQFSHRPEPTPETISDFLCSYNYHRDLWEYKLQQIHHCEVIMSR